MDAKPGGERFTTLPAPVGAEQLRTTHDPDPVPGDLADEYREQSWLVNSIS